MDRYGMRVRFHSDGSSIAHSHKTLEIPLPDGRSAMLKAIQADSLSAARKFSVQVRGFENQSAASAYGQRVKNAIRICGIQTRIGLDTGDDTSRGGVTEAGKAVVRQQFNLSEDIPILNDVHGLLVYDDVEPEPRFIAVNLEPQIARDKETFVQALQEGLTLAATLSERQALAAEMYNMSHFEGSPRARFLTLVTAVECVAQPEDLPDNIRAIVDRLSEEANKDDSLLKSGIQDSFFGRLRGLKKESIGKACERVVGSRMGEASRSQFKKWYNVRSKMVHTGEIPDGVDLGSEVARLDEMVSAFLMSDMRAS